MRHALRADLPATVDCWVDAFAADPYLRWIQPVDERGPTLPFNARLGFRVVAEVPTPDGAATLRPMHRAPVLVTGAP